MGSNPTLSASVEAAGVEAAGVEAEHGTRSRALLAVSFIAATAMVMGAVWLGLERAPALLLDLARLAGCA